MKQRKRITSGFFWMSAMDSFDKVTTELLRKAKAAEREEQGHDCGHLFEVAVSSRGHYGYLNKGPEFHLDSKDWSDPITITVRAHDLKTAVLMAAAMPFTSWFDKQLNLEEENKDA